MAHRFLNPIFSDWRASVLLVAALCLMPVVLLQDLAISNSPSDYHPLNSASSKFSRQASQIFPDYNFLNIAFKGDDLLGDEFLDKFQALSRALENDPFVSDVFSLFTMPDLQADADSLLFEALLKRETRLAMSLEQRRDQVLRNPQATGFMVSGDASVIAMAIRPTGESTTAEKLELYQGTLSAINAYGLSRYVAAISGQVASEVENYKQTVEDLKFFLLTTVITGSALAVLAFGRLFVLIPLLLTITASVGSSLVVVKLLGQPVTLITTVLPPMIASLAIALNFHWFNTLKLMKQQGLGHAQSISESLKTVHRPALLTALSTSAGLLSLCVSDIPPLRTIALSGPPGILVQYLFVFHLLPPILLRWDRGNWRSATRLNRLLDRLISVLRNLAIRYPRRILAVTGILLVIGLPQAFRVETETDFLRFYPLDSPLVESTEFFKQHLVGPAVLEIHVIGRESDSMTIPGNLRTIDQIASWARARPEVDRAASLADIVKEFHTAVSLQGPDEPGIPDTRELIAQYLLVYPAEDLYEVVDRSLSRSRIILNLGIQGSSAVRSLLADFREFASKLDRPDITIRVGGAMHQLVDFERELARGQRNSLFVAALAIVLILYIALRQPILPQEKPCLSDCPAGLPKTRKPERENRPEEVAAHNGSGVALSGAARFLRCLQSLFQRHCSARRKGVLLDTALCALANGSPILMLFIVMGASGVSLDMGTMMVASVAAGIAVDDTIHFFHHYQAQRRLGRPPEIAIGTAYDRAGRAITLTTLILVIQFGILGFSDFTPSRNFGLLVAMGLLAAWILDMLVLPSAILEKDGTRGERT